ncbi:uncharacterized protein LOC125239462 isoform X2 [Leguminivora glycinivorella]|uniref:uncharacterized protein LOC125239462 isoform X2 n=1 Tax=Leguminivora glycinivorella TaxID=1035111 RepID=UPI00200F8782|nr:uncharacterized protein LOC125239462 isoform X2 [Leguminivora glycinivorella]
MNYILYTFLVWSARSSVCFRLSRTTVQWDPATASSHTRNRAVYPTGIDMDYFGDSAERRLSPRTAEITDDDQSRFDSASSSEPILVFLKDEDFDDYRKMKKRARGSSSESEDSVSYKDVMQFLIQLDARLKQQAGHRIKADTQENIELFNFLRDNRRRGLGEAIENSDSAQSEREVKKRVKEESVERPKKRKKQSEEASRPRVKVGRVVPKKKETPIKKISFIRTPKPYIGKRGIYEDK